MASSVFWVSFEPSIGLVVYGLARILDEDLQPTSETKVVASAAVNPATTETFVAGTWAGNYAHSAPGWAPSTPVHLP